MKYIKDFDTWLNENYPTFGEESHSADITRHASEPNKELSTDIANLLFSFFDGGEQKFKRSLEEFNNKYKTSLLVPNDWTSLTILDDPEKIYFDVEEFTTAYNEYVT